MSGSYEQYTPKRYVDMAREVMGHIDLDPFSSAVANETVGAGVYFTEEMDGFNRPWWGKVWMNPPYTRVLINSAVDKLIERVQAGQVTEFVTLTNNATDTAWGQALLDASSLACFPGHRLSFIQADTMQPKRGNDRAQMFCYYGPNANSFRTVFSRIGRVR